MRTIALCWELGGGFGHLTSLLTVAEALHRRGDRVVLIARNLWSAATVFRSSGIDCFQAPFRHGPAMQYEKTPSFAYILHNIGFSDSSGLTGLVMGWRSLFNLIRPSLIIADHSPTALLAARGLGLPQLVWGTGFYCPPNTSPLPILLPAPPSIKKQSETVETRVLNCANEVLAGLNAPPLERLADLYHEGTKRFLLTFQEFDHYPDRKGESYRGYWPYLSGIEPSWPDTGGQKVFAYLKPHSGLDPILQTLIRLKAPTLVYIDQADRKLVARFEGPTLRFADGMLDLRAVGRTAALGITNGGGGITTALALSGVPQLCIPLQLEQWLVGQALERLGAGLTLTPEKNLTAADAIEQLLSDDRFRIAASSFATRYHDFSVDQQNEELMTECDAAMRLP